MTSDRSDFKLIALEIKVPSEHALPRTAALTLQRDLLY
jgi:hypothetical protein